MRYSLGSLLGCVVASDSEGGFSALCSAGLRECSLHQMPPAAPEGLPPGKQHGLQKRDLPERERQIPYDVTYTWNLKQDTNKLIYETETDSQTQRTDLWLPWQ